MTLAQNTASSFPGALPSAAVTDQAGSERSIRCGGRMFGNAAPARQAAMLFRFASLRSLGHQVMPGFCRAKYTTCWPVPLPASQHVTGPAFQELPQHRPNRLVVTMERRRVEAAIRRGRPAIPAEFGDLLRHNPLPPPALDRGVARCKNPPRQLAQTPVQSCYSAPSSTAINPYFCRASHARVSLTRTGTHFARKRFNCPHCQRLAFVLLTSYIPRKRPSTNARETP
jgi:hypothetical protein